jgi:hypothetical protein
MTVFQKKTADRPDLSLYPYGMRSLCRIPVLLCLPGSYFSDHPKTINTMKKNITSIVAAGCLSALSMQAQIYGEAYLQHSNSILTSAEITIASPGYLMSGYSPVSSGTTPDFVIDKTDNMLSFSNPTDFSMGYQIWDDVTCNNSTRTYNCGGVCVVETNVNNASYALAGAYDQGVFFALLDAGGNPIQTYRWAFPFTASGYEKPRIRESASVAGEFYICGHLSNRSYVFKIDANPPTPVALWNFIYTGQGRLDARDVIESPYNPNEVIVVGRVDVPSAGTAADGFFMTLDAGNGTFQNLLHYDRQNTGDDWFSSIEIASDPSAPGFILGGRSLFPLSTSGGMNFAYQQWMAKLDPTGNIIWSSLILPQGVTSAAASGREISDVFERKNQSGQYEYYGVASNYVLADGTFQNNTVVYKLDNNGNNSLNPNQFHYQYGENPGVSIYDHAQLTFINTGGNDDGFQVYGRDFATNEHYFVKSYFNGVSSSAGCEMSGNIRQIFTGPQLVGADFAVPSSLQAPCQSFFSLQANPLNTPVNSPCGGLVPSVSGGSNARPLGTGLSAYASSPAIEIYPNPVNDKTTIRFSENHQPVVTISVFNTLGQKVEVPFRPNGNGSGELDFSASDCTPGIYFLNVESGAEILKTRIIYEKR